MRGGSVRLRVLSVGFSLPVACRAKASTLLTKSSALNSISSRFIVLEVGRDSVEP